MAIMSKNIDKKQGFTLIELVIVMTIIVILAALIIGAILVVRQQARNTQLRNDAKTIKAAVEAYYARNKKFPDPFTPPSLDDRKAYPLTAIAKNGLPAGPLNEFLPNELTNPSSAAGKKGTVCYNKLTGTDGEYYRMWIVSESVADTLSSSTGLACSDNDNVCKCGPTPTVNGTAIQLEFIGGDKDTY